MSWKEVTTGQFEFEQALSQDDIAALLEQKDIAVLQCFAPIQEATWKLLNEQFFSVRNNVQLRVYGFYGEMCDLRFLSQMTNVHHLSVDALEDAIHVECIGDLPHLQSLHVGIYQLTDYTVLQHVPDTLEKLSLYRTKSKKLDLSVLRRFTHLKNLYLEGQQNNIESIAELTQLEELTLRSISTPTIEYIQSLTQLRALRILSGGISDVTAAGKLQYLQYLELWNIRGFADLSFISTMRGLQFVFLQTLHHVKAFPDLTHCTKLRRIYLEDLQGVTNVATMEFAPALEEFIYVDAAQLHPDDLLPVLKNPTLQRISVGFGTDASNTEFSALIKQYGKEHYTTQEFQYE